MVKICKGYDTCEIIIKNENGKEAERKGCGNMLPSITKQPLEIWAEYSKGNEESDKKFKLTAQAVLQILKRISKEDMIDLGFNPEFSRPSWMILQNFLIPPPSVRPSILYGSGTSARGEDDLTWKLADIVKCNQSLKRQEKQGTAAHQIQELANLLQFHLATIIDNEIAGLERAKQKSGRTIKSIRQRLKGKEGKLNFLYKGRVRGNLMGKRVDFSARTVITPDPNLSIDQVGIPRSVAKTLTYPETVTPYNIDKLTELIINGPEEHPGKTI
jgi:DNA-directed RNA polymerase II subunit RPB1